MHVWRMASVKAIERKDSQQQRFDENYEDEDDKFPSEMSSSTNNTGEGAHHHQTPPGVGFISFGATASGVFYDLGPFWK